MHFGLHQVYIYKCIMNSIQAKQINIAFVLSLFSLFNTILNLIK